MPSFPLPQRGRGATSNPPNRFDSQHFELEPDADFDPDDLRPSATELIVDASRSIIATNDSPDINFDASVNPYRGCEHGCSYCYARPYHEFLGYSAGLDFETKILYKPDAPELLRRELSSPRWVPQVLALSGVTDPYQPVERRLAITRRCIQVLADFRNPVGIITKGALVTRDADLLASLAEHNAARVWLSITSLDRSLARKMEPRASLPEQRLNAIATLTACGVPVGVMSAPMIPGLNDHELPLILEAAAQAGARYAGFTILRLPGNVAPVFTDWLDQHAPEKKERVLGRLKSMRAGRLNDPRFGKRMAGEGPIADAISKLFAAACRKHGLAREAPPLNTSAFSVPGSTTQLSLFA